MRLFDADPSIRWLFCLTHPDDELAICAWMRRLCQAGADVSVCWTHHTPVREQEAIANAKEIGLQADKLYFLDGRDGECAEQMPELWPQLMAIVEKTKPDRIVTIAFEQGHLDHDATSLLVHRSYNGPILEYPMYHPYTRRIQTMGRFSSPTGEEVLKLDPEEREFKKMLATRYPSQNIHSVLVWYFVYTCFTMRPVRLCEDERMRLKTHVDYLTPNLPEPLRSKALKSRTWKRWHRAATQFLNLESPNAPHPAR